MAQPLGATFDRAPARRALIGPEKSSTTIRAEYVRTTARAPGDGADES